MCLEQLQSVYSSLGWEAMTTSTTISCPIMLLALSTIPYNLLISWFKNILSNSLYVFLAQKYLLKYEIQKNWPTSYTVGKDSGNTLNSNRPPQLKKYIWKFKKKIVDNRPINYGCQTGGRIKYGLIRLLSDLCSLNKKPTPLINK